MAPGMARARPPPGLRARLVVRGGVVGRPGQQLLEPTTDDRHDLRDGHPPSELGAVHCRATFESPVGDPGRLLVDRSAKAIALVIGEDRMGGPEAGAGEDATVGAYCVAHARCPVHVVRRPNGAAVSGERPVAELPT